MTLAHRIEVVLSEDGKLSLERLPFRAGQSVEVIVLPVIGPAPFAPSPSLQGSVIQYDRPTEPVAETDWGASR